ncbi:serine/threonine-protein kinase [Actinocorallia populi]|uniref:serine/threonine-protein kinase n=1 Tax=Actinocorallia populi TaxID=2079200 RepID=UPI000D08820E|nr:serine/threonine-protein kinase [Actinocorallia populi]
MISGRYRVLEELGRGGMGVVLRAEDEMLGREVAIKQILVPEGLPAEAAEDRRQRMVREARAAARIRHGNVVTVYDVLTEDGVVHIVMEYVPGRSLAELVAREGPLTPARTARIGLALLDVLAAAHALGIVHRDVKPANVLVLADDEVKLADFGIAFLEGDPTITSEQSLIGSPAYMSPEQARGRSVSPATDLWSLAATLYFALEGRGPFDANTVTAVIAAVIGDTPRPPRDPGPELDELLFKLLTKDPAERPGAAWAHSLLARAAGTPDLPMPATLVVPPAAEPRFAENGQVRMEPPAEAFVARIKAGTVVRRGKGGRLGWVLTLIVFVVWLTSQRQGDTSGSGDEFGVGLIISGLVGWSLAALLHTVHAIWMFVFELATPRHLRISAEGIELVRGLRRVRFDWPRIAAVGIVPGTGAKPRAALVLRPVFDYTNEDPFAGQRLSWTNHRSPWREKATDTIGLCCLDELRTSPGRLESALRHFAPRIVPPSFGG